MPLTATGNTIAECFRTDCNNLGDNLKKILTVAVAATIIIVTIIIIVTFER